MTNTSACSPRPFHRPPLIHSGRASRPQDPCLAPRAGSYINGGGRGGERGVGVGGEERTKPTMPSQYTTGVSNGGTEEGEGGLRRQ